MTPQSLMRARRDKALKAAFATMGAQGLTALGVQRQVEGSHRETLRAILEDLVHARVLLVERSPRNNLYRPAPNWEEEFDAYIRAREARINAKRAAEPEDDGPGPGVPLVAYAMRNQPTSVWALGGVS